MMQDKVSKMKRELSLQLLDAARGKDTVSTNSRSSYRVMRSFPLTVDNLRAELLTPDDFHSTVCKRIRNAKDRVYLATLYIGAGGSGKVKEDELLSALRDCNARDIRVLMDRNRGLRPIERNEGGAAITTDSAKTSYEVLQQKGIGNVFLFQVLCPWQQWILPNPIDEVFGVFHIKCYIFDNDIILTGANLSEEYFTNRTDRYIWLTSQDEDSLVECYADIVKAFCCGAEQYKGSKLIPGSSKGELLESLKTILTIDGTNIENEVDFDDQSILAHAVPTFQAPSQVFHGYAQSIPRDVGLIENLLGVANSQNCHVRLASAYLNPTESFRAILEKSPFYILLTAGPLSHGFKPKTSKDGTNKGFPWIPAAYYALLERYSNTSPPTWFYQRLGWTFHAKGIWLAEPGKEQFKLNSRIRAVVHGSGNYGYRSKFRDIESNVILVMGPEQNTLEKRFRNEWNSYHDHCFPNIPRQQALPYWVKWALPHIRRFL